MARRLIEIVRSSDSRPNLDSDLLIAVRFSPDPGLIVSLLAIIKAGLAYVPLAPDWPELRIKHILDEAQPVLVLTNLGPDIFRRIGHTIPAVLQYSELLGSVASLSSDNLEPELVFNRSITDDRRRLLAVLYTSGSTGTPKGVRLLHRAALNRMCWYWRTFPYAADEVFVFKTTLTFVDSIAEIWSTLLQGRQ